MRHVLAGLALAALVAALLWWWSTGADPSVPAPAPPANADAPATQPAAAAIAVGAGGDAVAVPAGAGANATGVREAAAPAVALTVARVRIVDPDERPLEGAHVIAVAVPGANPATTDADGQAAVAVPVTGDSMHLRVTSGVRHYQAHWQRRSDLTIRLPWAGPLHGRLVDAATGAPIGNAQITHHHNYCKGCEPDRASSDANGVFTLPAVHRDHDCGFAFAVPGYAQQHQRLKLPGRGDAIEHTFRLSRGEVLAGRCVDFATRRPVAGAGLFHEGTELATTAADGSFRALVLPDTHGRFSARFESAGYCRTTIAIAVPQPDPAVEYALPAAAVVAGRVQTPDGAPIANVRVSGLAQSSGQPFPGLPDHVRVDDEDHDLSTTSGADGSFRLGGLVPGGKYWLRAHHADFRREGRPGPGLEIEVREGAPPVVLVLAPKPRVDGIGSIAGSYRYNGAVVPGVVAWDASGRNGRADVDANGAFRLEQVPAGRVAVRAMRKENEHTYGEEASLVIWRGDVDVTAGGEARLDVDHVVAEATIRGTVRFADGVPAAGRYVGARAGRLRVNGRTDDAGAFSLTVLSALPAWEVYAEHAENVSAAPGATDVALVAARTYTLRLGVRDRAGAVVAAELLVRRGAAGDFDPFHQWDAPDPQGYRELVLPAGEYGILCVAQGFAPQLQTVHVRGDTNVDVELQRGTTVTLRLHPDAAEADARLRVQVIPVDLADAARGFSFMWWRRHLDAVPLVRGGAAVAAVAPGTHRLVVSSGADVVFEPATVDVGAGPVTVDVKWSRPPK